VRHSFLRPIVVVIPCVAFVLLFAEEARAAAGRTPGTFAVSPTGAATYSIPIWVPGGPHGIQPSLTITYNSQSGDGILGPGWSLAGLSQISRCDLTVAQDSVAGPIALSLNDRLCLDGERLRLTSSDNLATYGEASTTYQPEVTDFTNVTAVSSGSTGPNSFTAQRRNGLIYEYGNTATSGAPNNGSQVLAVGFPTVVQWLLDKVSDRAGNNYVINYGSVNGSTGVGLPTSIMYTPTSAGATSYTYMIAFTYGSRVAQNPNTRRPAILLNANGTSVNNPDLLSTITVSYSASGVSTSNPGATIRMYKFGYTSSATTARALLTSITECADSAGANCLLPTNISYQPGTAGTTSTPATAVTGNVQVLATRDFNGDGRDDILYLNLSNHTLYVATATATGFAAPVSVAAYTGNTNEIAYGDLLGIGQNDILLPVSNVWWRYHYNGSSFTGTSTGVALDTGVNYAALVDLNGDGLADLVTMPYEGVQVADTGGVLYARLNTSSGGTVSFASSESATSLSAGCTVQMYYTCAQWIYASGGLQSRVRALDFDGDGRHDLLVVSQNYQNGGAISTSAMQLDSTSTATVASFTSFPFATNTGLTPVFLNADDDQCPDVTMAGILYISGCTSGNATNQSITLTALGAMDWDGDGRDDFLAISGSDFEIAESTGTTSTAVFSTSVPSSSNFFVFDQNGDGLADIGTWNSGGVSYYLHNGAGTPPDLVSNITDGFGNSVSPTYVSMLQSSYVPYQYGSPAYPYANYLTPLFVLSKATFSDPSTSGGTYYQSFLYSAAWTNLQGRGFATFGQYQIFDSRTSLYENVNYGFEFPYTGQYQGDGLGQASWPPYPNELVKQWNCNQAVTTLDSTANNQRYFPYCSSTKTFQYELGGTENQDLISTTAIAYTFDNYGNATTIASTVTDNDPGSPYNGQTWTTTVTNTPDVDTSTWCLPLFTETQVAYSASNGSTSVTRTKSFTPDLTNCRYTQIVTEPSSATYKVTEALAYDSFGNVDVDTITGIGMAARPTTVNWGTTGQFPMIVYDATGAETQVNYNFSYGLISSLTDPNGQMTSWAYGDGFARKTQETRPDGTFTQWSYNDCATFGGCIFGSHALTVESIVYNTDSSIETDGSTYYDQVDRPLVQSLMALGGTTWNRVNETRYDSLGRVAEQAPPCAWAAVTTPCSNWTTYSYDALNRVTESQRPTSSTNSNPETTTYQYAGRTSSVIDPTPNTTTTITDVNGWLRQTKDPYGYTVTVAYDAAGSKTGVTDSLGDTLLSGVTYAYGIRALRLTSNDADRGAWSYTYDALGEKTAWKDAKGQSFSATFDVLSRPLTRSEPDLFTQWTWGATAANHNIGKLAIACNGTGTNPTACTASGYSETDTYDSHARPYQRSITIPGDATFTYTYQYGATTGLLTNFTYPVSTSGDALQLLYAYSAGFIQSITAEVSGSPNVTVWTANTMNPASQVTKETLGNGIVVNRTYDAVTSWLGSLTAGVGGGAAVENQSYLYDLVGDVTQRQNNNLGLTENLYYDNDYRLSTSKLNNVQNLAMGYALNGNITSRSDVAAGAAWTYDPVRVHAVTQAGSSAYTYTYDANGNASSRNGYTVGWTSYNYPTSISTSTESVQFSYGPGRQRWQQNYNNLAEVTEYVGGLLEHVFSGGTNTYRHYIYAGNEPVAVYSRTSTLINTWSYFLSDQESSVAAITSNTGAVDVNESFTAFGARRNPTTWSGAPVSGDLTTIAGLSRQGYTFQTALGQSMGLNHMNGRVQDAITGRFLSADPHIPDPTNTQDYNRYSYVRNSPLSYVDPSGFWQFCITVPFIPSGGADNGVPGGLPQVTSTAEGVGSTTCYGIPGPPGGGIPIIGGQDTGSASNGAPTRAPCKSGTDCFLQPTKATPAKKSTSPCFNGSIGISGSLMGGLAGGPTGVGVGGSGGQSIGFSYGGSLLDSNLFWAASAAGMITGGLFGGVGFSAQGGSGAIASGVTTTTSFHTEVNSGAGLEGSVSSDLSSDGSLSAGGYASGLPGGRVGFGIGLGAGVGPETTTTVGSPTLRDILNALGLPAGSAAACGGQPPPAN
jgi:RHS repeat-associated protein